MAFVARHNLPVTMPAAVCSRGNSDETKRLPRPGQGRLLGVWWCWG